MHRVVVDGDKDRAQALMTAHDFIEALFQSVEVEIAGQAEGCRDVIGWAIGIQAVQEP
ncbi:hypothetical protein D3C83_103380 [compost metagenome]